MRPFRLFLLHYYTVHHPTFTHHFGNGYYLPFPQTADEGLFGDSWNTGREDVDQDCANTCDGGEVPHPCTTNTLQNEGAEMCDPLIDENRVFMVIQQHPDNQYILFSINKEKKKSFSL